jgi:hypothetical protein
MRFVLLGMIFVFLYKIIKVMYADLKNSSGSTDLSAGIEVVEVDDECSIPLGSVYPLHPVTNIGRMPGNNIVLDSQYVSNYHAKVYIKNNSYIMKDMGSTNGTYLNGSLIDKPVIIKNDDLIGIGGVTFKVIG